jgi:hypothetical protein
MSPNPSLLSEIERDVLSNAPLADALRKCVVLGGRAGSVELREWATRELRGYGSDDDVPEYRTLAVAICLDAVIGNSIVSNQRIRTGMLPEFARDDVKEEFTFRQGVGALEAMVESAEASDKSVKLSLPMSMELAAVMDSESANPFQHITALYWSVASSSLRGIVDQVRTTLAELVAEMRASMPRESDPVTASVANQAVNVAVHGKARVSVTAAQASGAGVATAEPHEPQRVGFWTTWRRIGAFVVGAATVGTGLIALVEWLHH